MAEMGVREVIEGVALLCLIFDPSLAQHPLQANLRISVCCEYYGNFDKGTYLYKLLVLSIECP